VSKKTVIHYQCFVYHKKYYVVVITLVLNYSVWPDFGDLKVNFRLLECNLSGPHTLPNRSAELLKP